MARFCCSLHCLFFQKFCLVSLIEHNECNTVTAAMRRQFHAALALSTLTKWRHSLNPSLNIIWPQKFISYKPTEIEMSKHAWGQTTRSLANGKARWKDHFSASSLFSLQNQPLDVDAICLHVSPLVQGDRGDWVDINWISWISWLAATVAAYCPSSTLSIFIRDSI